VRLGVPVVFEVAPTINRCTLHAAANDVIHVMTSSPIDVSYVKTDTLTLTCNITGAPAPTYVAYIH